MTGILSITGGRTDGPAPVPSPTLSRPEKAAIVVKFLMEQGVELDIHTLPEALQLDLTQKIGALSVVDRTTLANVVQEFATELDHIGLSFRGGLSGALDLLEHKISPSAARKLRSEAGIQSFVDPWERLNATPLEDIITIAETEQPDIAAVLLSKLDVARAAKVLSGLPGDIARKISYAISRTSQATPQAVDRIGQSLVAQLDNRPERAFAQSAESRIAAILTVASPETREAVLESLEQTDAELAGKVRHSVFSFADIPTRIHVVDVPKIMRVVDQNTTAMALKYATETGDGDVCDFILDNMSKRMSEAIREEIEELDTIDKDTGQDALNEIVSSVQSLIGSGEISWKAAEA